MDFDATPMPDSTSSERSLQPFLEYLGAVGSMGLAHLYTVTQIRQSHSMGFHTSDLKRASRARTDGWMCIECACSEYIRTRILE